MFLVIAKSTATSSCSTINTMMVFLIVQALFVLLLCWKAQSFCQNSPHCLVKRGKNLNPAGSLTQLKPVGGDGVIPRLEPGLRFMQSRANFLAQLQDKKVKISRFSLNCLSNYAPERSAASPPLSDVLSHVFNAASTVSTSLSRYARKGLALTVVVATLRAFPGHVLARGHSPLRTATLFGTALLASVDLASAAPSLSPAPSPISPSILSRTSSKASELVSKLNPQRLWNRNFNVDLNFMKWKNYDTLSSSQRLGTTPVYFVANARGSSYVQNDAKAGNPEQKIVTYFLGYDDASRVLQEMTQMNSNGRGGTADFRLKTTSLERVMDMIRRHRQSRKLGRFEVDTILRIQPSGHQYNNALKLAKLNALRMDVSRNLDLRGVHIPLFKAEGFTMKRSNGEVVTPYYFAYEDLLDDWNGATVSTSTSTSSGARSGTSGSGLSSGIGASSGSGAGSSSSSDGVKDAKFSVTDLIVSKTVGGLKSVLVGNGQPKVSVHDLADVMCCIENITPTTTLPPLSRYNAPLTTTRWQRLQQRVERNVRTLYTLHRAPLVRNWVQKVSSVGGLLKRENKEEDEEVEEEVEESSGSGSGSGSGGSFMSRFFGGKVGEIGGSVDDSSGGAGDSANISAATNTRDFSDVGISESDSTGDNTIGSGSDGGVWVTIKKSVGSVISTLRGAHKGSKEVIGIVPPKKEIDLLRRFYRNQVGFRNEFARAKFMG